MSYPSPQLPPPTPPVPLDRWEPRMRAHPHPEPRSYPLMLRTWDYRWWKPLVGIVVLVFGGMVVMPLVLMPVLAAAVAVEGGPGSFVDRFLDAASLKDVTPASMLYLNLTLASLTLIAMGIVRFLHRLRPRWLSSVMPGMRWRFFFACFGLAIVALVASVLMGALLPTDPNNLGGGANKITGQLIAVGVVILLTTPLQALGEEYAFRGYLMQAFGSLTRSRFAAVGITSLLFALAHGTQNFPLFFDRFAFGVMAGLTVVVVGGLEAGIALHILNNLVAFAFAIFFGDLQGALAVAEVSWWQLPVTIVQNGLYLLLVLLVARRMGLRNTTTPPVVEKAHQPVG
ncbi:MAG: type II CAAX endopeptidase family protein [Marmoricola sp.]